MQWTHGITVEMKGTIKMATAFFSLSAAVNVILVVLIAGRLLHMRHRFRRLLGTANSDYLSITTMLVESAAIYALNVLWAIIPYALNHPSHHLAVPLMGQTAVRNASHLDTALIKQNLGHFTTSCHSPCCTKAGLDKKYDG